MATSEVLTWLLEGDASVRYVATRDLLGRDDPALQALIATEGTGAAILAARGADGHWGRGFYQPKWTSSHYTLLQLCELGLSPTHPAARATVALILDRERADGGELSPFGSRTPSDACVNGMALRYASWFGATDDQLRSVVDFLLRERVADGGFNCQHNRPGAPVTHSSLHTTVCVMEGMTQYLRSGGTHRVDELRAAFDSSAEFLLRHRLLRSERTGAVIHPEMTRLHFPTRWHYDVLRGLDSLAAERFPRDRRMDEALALLLRRRGRDGRWRANRAYPGVTHVPDERAGQPSRWVTLVAERVLVAYPR